MNKKAEEEILKQEATKLLAHIQTAGSHQEEAHQGPLAPPTDWPYWQRWQAVGNNWQPAGGSLPAGYQADPPGFAPLRDGDELYTPAFPAQELELAPELVDVVIPYRLENDGAELRYCLRSLVKNLIGLGRIFLVGEQLPSWLRPDGQRLIHLPVPDICQIADVAIWHKLFMACQEVRGKPKVADRFLFVSDDQVLLRPVSVKQFGPYHYGDIQELASAYQVGWWARLRHTGRYLQQHGKTTLHGDVHAPILMERDQVLRIMAETAWRPAPGLCVGSLYLNWTGQAAQARPMGPRIAVVSRLMGLADLHRELAGRWFLVYTAAGWGTELQELLEQILPTVSPWEKILPDNIVLHSILPAMQRNLIYHVYPVAANTIWKENIRELVQRWHVFNGKKIIGIVLDAWTVSLAEVQRLFPDDPAIEWLVAPNNPARGETITFLPAASRLQTLDPREATFYAHAKGVMSKYPQRADPLAWQYGNSQWWTYMYRYCLDCPIDWLDWLLQRYACAGTIQKVGSEKFPDGYRHEAGRPLSKWHYTGTFWWFNHARFFSKSDALQLGPSRWALERHLGELFEPEEAYALDGISNTRWQEASCLYLQPADWWRETFRQAAIYQQQAYDRWRQEYPRKHIELYIITPVSRPENLPKLEQSINEGFKIVKPLWHLVVDPKTAWFPIPRSAVSCEVCGLANTWGHSQRNVALDRISSGWIFILDDDTIIHPNLESVFLKAVADFPTAQVIVFQQVDKAGQVRLRARPPVRVGAIDTGSAIVRRDFIGYIRLDWQIAGDGRWYEQLYQKNPGAFVFIDQPASYYNALR